MKFQVKTFIRIKSNTLHSRIHGDQDNPSRLRRIFIIPIPILESYRKKKDRYMMRTHKVFAGAVDATNMELHEQNTWLLRGRSLMFEEYYEV